MPPNPCRQNLEPSLQPKLKDYLTTTLKNGMIIEKISAPKSSGHLMLASLDANANPIVTFNYFHHPEDLQKCVKGMEVVIKVLKSRAMAKIKYPLMPVQALINFMAALPNNLRPRHLSTPLSLERFCRDTVMTIWHYHGGCQVDRVVDKDYKVIGVDGLRVVDSSTFSFDSPGTNPQATVMMMGRYVFDIHLRLSKVSDPERCVIAGY